MKISPWLLVAVLTTSSVYAQEAGPAKSLFDLVQAGGWVMIPLGFASVLTVMLVMVYLVTLRRGAVVSREYMETAAALLRKRDYLGLLAVSNRHNEAVARIASRMLDFANTHPTAPMEALREVGETEGGRVANSLNHRITYLADVGVMAPMLGLLGTVVGIIQSFGELGKKTGDASQPILLAQGVGQALVTTAAGIIIGIVAMTFYAFFRGRVQGLISDLEGASTHLLSLFAISYDKKNREPVSSRRSALDDDDY
ncbi:MAG TPA: MotA/TolQ/ExbB proton channel family protein [Chthoniobacterales bacterium]|jgi:biopolymer transport protein ExbB